MMDLASMTYRPESTSTSQGQQVAALTNWRTSSMEDSDTKNSDMKGHLLNDCIQTVGLCFIIRVSSL